jgi:hypothetical protein
MPVRNRKKPMELKPNKQNGNIYVEHPSISTRRNIIDYNDIDFLTERNVDHLFDIFIFPIFRFKR